MTIASNRLFLSLFLVSMPLFIVYDAFLLAYSALMPSFVSFLT